MSQRGRGVCGGGYLVEGVESLTVDLAGKRSGKGNITLALVHTFGD